MVWHYGLINAVLLPLVLRFVERHIAVKVAPMCGAMGVPGADLETCQQAVCDLLDRCNIPRSMAELEVTADRVDSIAAKAMTDTAAGTNPRPASLAEVQDLIAAALVRAG